MKDNLLRKHRIFFANFQKMRQLKGKVKESAREKRERKKEFMENKEKLFTIALPTFGVVFLLVGVFIYLSTRPKSVIGG